MVVMDQPQDTVSKYDQELASRKTKKKQGK